MPDASGRLLLGVDVGTFETKGTVVDLHGTVVATATRQHGVSTHPGGRVEHDAERDWWGDFVGVVRDLLSDDGVRPEEIAALCCSGIGPCVLPVDSEWQPLAPAILYGVDTRAGDQIAAMEQELGTEAILARSGNELSSQSAGPKIAWLAEHLPEVHARARWFVTSHTFLVGRLTGEAVVDHTTASYFHPLYDLRRATWDTSGCEDFVSLEQLPRLGWPSEVAGLVSEGAAAETGLRAGTPVAVGTADAQAEALACGVVAPGDTMVMYGSSSFMIQTVSEPVASRTLWSAPYLFEGSYALAAGTSTAGTATRWMADILGLGEGSSESVFAELVALAQDSPAGARGLMVLPYLSGERTPLHDPDLTGAILGMRLEHSRADVARATLEGIAHSMAHALEAFDEAEYPPQRLLAVGGGTRNAVWLQALSDIVGRDQTIVEGAGASQGGCALAALAVGVLTEPEEVRDWVRLGARIVPDPQREHYAHAHELFVAATQARSTRTRRDGES